MTESSNDQLHKDLPKIASTLVRIAQKGGLTADRLRTECSWLSQQISQDASRPRLFDLWGQSSNIDELAGKAIVEPGVLLAIGQTARIPMEGPVVHAGLQHTYGYLLSTIETPYGYKRDRWVSSHLERGFGLPTDVLGPNPSQGTLLTNATRFAGMIAFRSDEKATQQLRRVTATAAAAIRQLDAGQLQQTRIKETLSLRDDMGRFGSVHIFTDLVPFPLVVEGSADDCLLVYSFSDSRQPGKKLVTLFPVAPPMVLELTDPSRFGRSKEIRTRFNAFVPGVTGQTLIGERSKIELPAGRTVQTRR